MSNPLIKLSPITSDDLPLYTLMFSDAIHMKELGGPQPIERIPETLQKQIAFAESGKGWVFKIVASDIGESVGTVMLWKGEYKGEDTMELGWGVHHNYKNRGYGTAAVSQIIQMAKDTQKWSPFNQLHAFTTVTNVASNRLCEKIEGFRLLEQCDIDYDGNDLHCNHWLIDI